MDISYIEEWQEDNTFHFYGGHVFKQGDKVLLVSRENGTSILMDTALLGQIKSGGISDSLKRKLVQRGFATYGKSRPISDFAERVCPVFFMVDITKSCCLACRYCFRDFEDKTLISDKVLEDICHFIIRHCIENRLAKVNVQAWGGEPTLAFDKVCKIHEIFARHHVGVTLCMETNGVPVSREIARKAKEMSMRIGVSIDGYPGLHDRHRPTVSGKGSFEQALKGLKNFHAAGFYRNHQVICVVTKHSLGEVERIVDYFCEDLDLNYFKFGIIKPNPQMKELGLEVSEEEAAAFAARMFRAVVRKARSGKTVTEANVRVRIMNILNRKTQDICFSRGCMGGRKMVAFDQLGNIFCCELMDLKNESFGSIYDGKSLNEMVSAALRNHPFFTIKNDPACGSCPWHFFCRGGCTSANRYIHGRYTPRIDKMTCAFNRTIYPMIVELLLTEPAVLQRMSGNYWDNPGAIP